MSIPTLQGLQTALSGLMAEQQAIDIAGHNIANANTEGYTRESVELGSNMPIEIAALSTVTGKGGQLGTGVSVEAITRIRNAYLDAQYRTQNSALSSASTTSEELHQAQAAFNEPSSSGIASQLSEFWSAWNTLANEPNSKPAREAVVSAGNRLAGGLREVGAQLEGIAEQAAAQLTALTEPQGEVNSYATQIAQLNGQIRLSEEAGQQPNDMLDRRDLLLDKLSALGQITVTKQANGTDTVTFGDASKPLVEGTAVNWPQVVTSAAGGKVGALLGLIGPEGALTSLQTSLNNVAATLASSVNALHTNTPFFTGNTAATLAVAVDGSEVEAGSGEEVGANNVAREIAALRGGEAEQGYTTLIEQVGSAVKTADGEKTNMQTTLSAISDQRQSVSSVSLDEEMTNLMSFQRGYQASARTLTTMDEMLETLIEHTGRVGL
jgi:flagellar hook-associated protein 1 FlgK